MPPKGWFLPLTSDNTDTKEGTFWGRWDSSVSRFYIKDFSQTSPKVLNLS